MTLPVPQEPRAALYTPDTLAERWNCSGKTVRLLIEAGKLRAFRVGERLIRIPAEAVEEYECRSIASPATAEPGPSPSGKTDAAPADLRSALRIGRRLNAGAVR